MAAFQSLLLSLLLFCLIYEAVSQSVLRFPSYRNDDDLFCGSWRLSVETNNAGNWMSVPSRCWSYVEEYMNGGKYFSDSEIAASDSLAFAQSIEIGDNGKDAWIFDIDETLVSNLPYYQLHGYGSENFDEFSFNKWVELGQAPALPASLKLYKKVKQMGFKVFLLTGRSEYQRSATVKNLVSAGYSDWERLILRGISDEGESATVFKSKKRSELVEEGYRIHGNSGDQWSDLLGFAVAERSFKLPNPIYFIP
ncbi:hypothetical protein K2173_005315 [Erythroxylum novogranatense]|uniref:Acid phosphatase 1 n=1 Tax=Erythroxylum novogranatense TaxID=1862640 RepID=A0AAV8TKL2_9ROSI|nr:hypothetical protein K2173_005315 [Erythroxylum novogranatense]